MKHEPATATAEPIDQSRREGESTSTGEITSNESVTASGVGSESSERISAVAGGNRWNRIRYGLYAPVYELVAKPLEAGRRRAIDRLALQDDDRILILGSGPGVDLAHLPAGAAVTAIDITPSMIRRTERRADDLGIDVDARVGDAQDLPFDDGSFDAVLLHLVLTVVPTPTAVVRETARVLADGGRVSIYDKFVPPDETPSLPRRVLNPLAKALFSDLTRPLDPMVEDTDLVLGPRESVFRGLYTVTTARRRSRE